MAQHGRPGEAGQGTVEWIALVLLVALAMASAAAVAGGVPGADLGRALASKLLCAARVAGTCEGASDRLAAEYGIELADLARRHAPTIHFPEDASYLPVDHRRCREPGCAGVDGDGEVWRTEAGLSATALTRVVDCRPEAELHGGADAPDCDGERAGNVYLQYWLYYPDSRTPPWGERGYHPDDWESLQVRVGDRVEARASSHHSYNHRGGIRNWPSDAGIVARSGWGPYDGELHVTAGSHAGRVRDRRRGHRHVPARRLRLIPLEPLGAAAGPTHDFAVTPPWLKRVYLDPEATGT